MEYLLVLQVPGSSMRRLDELAGMSYGPITDRWMLSRDLDVNYLGFAVKE